MDRLEISGTISAGIDQVRIENEFNRNLNKCFNPDGWDLPVLTKCLVVLPKNN